MMEKPPKKPRLSISVTMLEDPDYWTLVGKPGGHLAFGCFIALCLHCKNQKNQGEIKISLDSLSRMIGWSGAQISKSIELIKIACEENQSRPWVSMSKNVIHVRSFEKWNNNGWGGTRPGSGRKSSGNQDENSWNQDDSSPSPSPTPSNTPLPPKGGKRLRRRDQQKLDAQQLEESARAAANQAQWQRQAQQFIDIGKPVPEWLRALLPREDGGVGSEAVAGRIGGRGGGAGGDPAAASGNGERTPDLA